MKIETYRTAWIAYNDEWITYYDFKNIEDLLDLMNTLKVKKLIRWIHNPKLLNNQFSVLNGASIETKMLPNNLFKESDDIKFGYLF
jgi:hypothetical protein